MWKQWNSLVEIRTVELRLYWTRFNAMLVINGGLFALYQYWNPFKNADFSWAMLFFPIFGFLFSILGTFLLVGSHRWVIWWEDRLHELEGKMKLDVSNTVHIFRVHPHYAKKGTRHISTFETADRIMYLILCGWIGLLIAGVAKAVKFCV